MNGIFKAVVVALMAALFAAANGDPGRVFQRGSADLMQTLTRLP